MAFQKLSRLEGGRDTMFFVRMWINVKRGDGTFFIILQFNHIYCACENSKVSFITFWFFSLLSEPCKIFIQVFIVLKHGIICIFLIHSGSTQKMLTALFKLV